MVTQGSAHALNPPEKEIAQDATRHMEPPLSGSKVRPNSPANAGGSRLPVGKQTRPWESVIPSPFGTQQFDQIGFPRCGVGMSTVPICGIACREHHCPPVRHALDFPLEDSQLRRI